MIRRLLDTETSVALMHHHPAETTAYLPMLHTHAAGRTKTTKASLGNAAEGCVRYSGSDRVVFCFGTSKTAQLSRPRAPLTPWLPRPHLIDWLGSRCLNHTHSVNWFLFRLPSLRTSFPPPPLPFPCTLSILRTTVYAYRPPSFTTHFHVDDSGRQSGSNQARFGRRCQDRRAGSRTAHHNPNGPVLLHILSLLQQ